MKTIIVIESLDELLKFACPARSPEDKDPYLPDASVIIDVDSDRIQLKADGFELRSDIRIRDLITKLLAERNLRVVFVETP